MRFRHRIHNMVYAVPSRDWEVAPFGKGWRREPKVTYRAEFQEGAWDSLDAQRLYSWTDEERAFVEDYLKAHKDFNVSGSLVSGIGGLFAEDKGMAEQVPMESGDQGIARDEKKRCAYTKRLSDGTTQQCGRFAAKDSESRLCGLHERKREEAEVTT